MEQELDALTSKLGCKLENTQRAALLRYADLCRVWNARMNLTGSNEATQLSEILFMDALVLHQQSWLSAGDHLLDVGAGVGAPAIPLAILEPGLRVTLVESLDKRVAFLRTVAGALNLVKQIQIRKQRVSVESPEVQGSPFDFAMARATFALEEWVPLGLDLAHATIAFSINQELPNWTGIHEAKRVGYRYPSTKAPRALHLCVTSAEAAPEPTFST